MRALVAANVAVAGVMLLVSPETQARMVMLGGFIPLRLTLAVEGGFQPLAAAATLITHMFLHGGLLHLALNMLVLVALGRLLEPWLGHGRFALLYGLSGVAGALAEWVFTPMGNLPAVGASGAISGLVAAQALLFGQSRLGPFGQALALAAVWLLVQYGAGIAFADAGIKVAVAAHLGGFLAGLVLARPLSHRRD